MKHVACLLASLVWVQAAWAGSFRHADLVGLAKAADVIAVGVCQSAESAWDEQHRFIVTTIRFQPTQSFKGTAADVVTVKVLGGQAGDEGMTVSHSVAMHAGEEAVLFLQHSQFGSYFVIAGGPEGKLPVHRDVRTGQPMIRGTMSVDEFSTLIAPGSE